MTEPTLCRSCLNLRTCELLGAPPQTNSNLVITEENQRHCEKWITARPMVRAVRRAAYDMSGLSAIKAVRVLTNPELNETEVEVSEYLPEVELVDRAQELRDLAGNSITYKVRRDQLQYRVSKDGQVELDPHGNPVPRETFWLFNYAIRQLEMEPDVVRFWKGPQLITEILKKEKELGIVVSADQMRKSEDTPTPNKEKKMARTINLRQGKLSATPQTAAEPAAPAAQAAAGPKMPPKLGRPLTGKKPPAETPPVPAAEVPAPSAPADLSFISAELESVKHQLVEMEKKFSQMLEKQLNDISTLMAGTQQAVNNNTDEGVTILHDVLMQRLDPDGNHGLIEQSATIHAYTQGDEADSGN